MKIHLFLAAFFYLFCFFAKSQTLDDAKKLYSEGNYAKALSIFEKEYDQAPQNASLNCQLGICLYETGDFTRAEKHLAFASQKRISEAYFYYGKLLTKMYRFEEADKEFQKYKRAKQRDKAALDDVEKQEKYIEKLKKEISRTEDVQIIDSMVVSKKDFLSAYHLSESTGTLTPVKKFFELSESASNFVLYMNEKKDKVYYSQAAHTSPGKLFTMEKLLTSFGDEKMLPEPVNTNGTQAYPFVLTDGLTLYFASTGHESIGGYDLCVTRYNIASNNYLAPNRLNMPFNSPFNDYMMVIDEEKGVGWFASERFQPKDSVCVYTFIPASAIHLVESDNEDYLIRRAQIHSIKESWKEGKEYALLIEKARKSEIRKKVRDVDFEFVINDDITYHSLSDFKNPSAQSIFRQTLSVEEENSSIKKELSRKREQYIHGTMNEALKNSILHLEIRVEESHKKAKRMKKEARNLEISYHQN